MRRRTLAVVPFALLAASPVTLGSASLSLPTSAAGQCEALRAYSAEGLSIVSAELTGTPGSSLCRVTGVARRTRGSEIRFELWLPSAWNGRYVQLGNGGFAGNIDEPSLTAEVRRGNAAAMADTGHRAGQFDASWALGQPDRIVDYGHRSIKVTSDAAHGLIRAFYGRPSVQSYYVGCSNLPTVQVGSSRTR